MTLNEICAQYGKDASKITKIYHGRDNWCRCGCGGSYFDKGEKGFTRAVNFMNKNTFNPCSETDAGTNYINIPTGNPWDDKCYCVYFD